MYTWSLMILWWSLRLEYTVWIEGGLRGDLHTCTSSPSSETTSLTFLSAVRPSSSSVSHHPTDHSRHCGDTGYPLDIAPGTSPDHLIHSKKQSTNSVEFVCILWVQRSYLDHRSMSVRTVSTLQHYHLSQGIFLITTPSYTDTVVENM